MFKRALVILSLNNLKERLHNKVGAFFLAFIRKVVGHKQEFAAIFGESPFCDGR